MKIDNLSIGQWARYLKNTVRKNIFWFFFGQVGRANLFLSCVAYLFFFTDRERRFVARELEKSILKTRAIVKRHPNKYPIVYEGFFG